MATNIAYRSKGYDFISFRAWYNGNTPATHCEFFIAGAEYETVYYPDGSGSDTNWTTPYIDATGLTPNTNYRIMARFRGSGNSILGIATMDVTTDKIPTPINPPTRLNISTTYNSATLSWGGASGGIDFYEIYVDHSYIGSTTSTSYTITGLWENATFEFCVYAVNEMYFEGICKTATTKSLPTSKPANLTGLSYTSDEYYIYLSWNSAARAEYYEIYQRVGGLDYYLDETSSTSYTVYGDKDWNELQPGISYTLIVKPVNHLGAGGYQTIVAKLYTGKPDDWQWQTNFQVGMEFAVNYSSSLGNYIYIMPATEWNSFLAKINEFRVYKDLSEVSFPTYVKNNYFTYTVYNQAISAINAMSAYFIGYTTIPTKSSGSELTAADFFRLRDTLNSID